MVLYHAISIYQLLVCICLRFLYAKREGSVCILPDFIVRKFPEYKRLEEQGVFDRVVLYPYTKVPVTSSMDLIEKLGDEFWGNEFSCSLRDFTQIYCGGTHFHFVSYLVSKRIHFCYIEDGSGIWADIENHKISQRTISPIMYEVTEANGLYDGSSPYIDKIYACIPAEIQSKEGRFADPRLVRFNVVDWLRKISGENVDRICASLGYRDLQLPPSEDITLFLTDHAANMNLLSWDEQIRRNLLTVDYFHLQSNLVIKPHPDDLAEYRYYFPDAVVLPNLFPVELLMGIVDFSRIQIITFGSTSVNNIRTKKVVNLYGEYSRKVYEKIHLLYAAWKLYRDINEEIPCELAIWGDCENAFQAWESEMKENYSGVTLRGRFFFICRDGFSSTQLRKILDRPKSVVILDDMYDSLLDIVREKIYILLPKCLEIRNDRKGNVRREFLYILTTDKEIRKIVQEFHYKRYLKYAGELVEIKTFNEQECQSMALEQVLRSTERRLLDVLEENKQLRFEL